jgi:hypothetical protein
MKRTKRLAIAVTALVCLAGPRLSWSRARARVPSGASPNGIVVQQVVCTSASPACVWTYHNDNTRGGVNPNESTLTPQNVANLTVLKSVTTDGLIYAQPLYISGIGTKAQGTNCGGGTKKRNMVYVATENDSIYAFDDVAADTTPCWQTSLAPSGETPVPYSSLPVGESVNGVQEPCNLLVPQIGITGTPVIDINVTPPLMYVVAATVDGTGTVHLRLHIVRLFDGNDLCSLEVGSTAGLGAAFNPAVQQQRPGLALVHQGETSTVYMSFGSFCDSSEFSTGVSPHPAVGWLISFEFDYSGGGQVPPVSSTAAFQTATPITNTEPGSLWGGGAAPAIDAASGTVFVPTANGNFNGSSDWGDTILQLHSGLASSIDDWYTPNDYFQIEEGGNVCLQASCTPSQQITLVRDSDFGAGGLVLLATKSLALNNPELIAAGKQGMIYLTWYGARDPATGYNEIMGGLDGTSCGYSNPGCTESPGATDCTPGAAPAAGTIAQCWEGFSFVASRQDQNGSRGSPAFIDGGVANNYLYTVGVNDNLKAFSFTASNGLGTFNTTPIQPVSPAHQFLYPGSSPSITWDGSNFGNAIVWTVDTSGSGAIKFNSSGMPVSTPATKHASIYAYAAQPAGGALTLLWSDTTHGPGSVKFVPPTIANGMLFVAGGNNNPFYDPGATNGTTNCSVTGPTNCGELVIWQIQ